METVNLKFETQSGMAAFLKGLKYNDHLKMASRFGVKPIPRSKEQAALVADYLVQGINKGLTGEALAEYAKERTNRLAAIIPELTNVDSEMAVGNDPVTETVAEASVEIETQGEATVEESASVEETAAPIEESTTDATVTTAIVAETPKRARKVSKTKYPDGSIVARLDRGGFDGWYAGRAEAFRPTVEKVQQFFAKKYPDIVTVVVE